MLVAAAVLVVLSVRYAGVEGADSWDHPLDAIARWLVPGSGDALRPAVFLFGPVSTALVSAVLAVASLLWGHVRLAVLCVLAPMATAAVTLALQALVGRSLNGGDALPSGHTAAATCTVLVAVVVIRGLIARRGIWINWLTVIAVVGVPATMSVALISNDLHVATDAVAGFCAALVVVLGTAIGIDRSAAMIAITRRSRPDDQRIQ